MLKLVAISCSRGSPPPGDQTCVSCITSIGRQILYYGATWEAQIHAHTQKVSVFCLCPQQFFKPGQVTLTSGQFLGLAWQSSCEDSTTGGTGSISGWGTKIPHAVWYGQKKKKSKVSGHLLYLRGEQSHFSV